MWSLKVRLCACLAWFRALLRPTVSVAVVVPIWYQMVMVCQLQNLLVQFYRINQHLQRNCKNALWTSDNAAVTISLFCYEEPEEEPISVLIHYRFEQLLEVFINQRL